MRLITNEEVLVVSGGEQTQTVEITGKRMSDEEKQAYDEQQAREAEATFKRETRGK